MSKGKITLFAVTLAIVAIMQTATESAHAQINTITSFTAGDLIVAVEGNGMQTPGVTYADGQASPLTLYEYSLTGTSSATLVGGLVLPQAATGTDGNMAAANGNFPVSGEYGSSSEATLQLSGNGQYLTIMGYGVNAQTYNSTFDVNGTGTALAQSPNGTSSNDVTRVIALIGANGSVNSTTALTNVFNENNPRSVYTENGTSFYVSGQGNHDDTGGVFYVPNVGATTGIPITGVDTHSNSYGSYNQDTRDVQIVNGQLVVSVDSSEGTASKGYDIDRIGTLGSAGSPPTTTLNQQPTALPGINGAITLSNGNGNSINGSTGSVYLSPENFFFANSTTLYVADTGDPKNGGQGSCSDCTGDGGLQKWSLVNGTWVLDYTLSAGLNLVNYVTSSDGVTGLYGLTGEVVDGTVELFATSYTAGDTDESYLYGITDTLSDTTAAEASDETFDVLDTGPAGEYDFKGLAFAPVAETPLPPGLPLLLSGLVVLGLAARFRRSPAQACPA